MAVRLARSQRAAVAAQGRAERAEAATLERLRDSLLARSRATRLAGLRGQRDEALAAATEAAQIRGGLDARDEVIAALARPEIVQVREFQIRPVVGGMVAFDPNRDRYAVETGKGQLELRRLSDDTMIQSLRGTPSKLWSTPVFSPDGRWIAARNENGEEIIWSDKRPDLAFVLKDRPYVLPVGFSSAAPRPFHRTGSFWQAPFPPAASRFTRPAMARSSAGSRPTPWSPILAFPVTDGGSRWGAGSGETWGGRVPARAQRPGRRRSCKAAHRGIVPDDSLVPGNNRLMTGAEEFRIFGIPGGESLNRVSDPLALLAFFGPGGSTVLSSGDSGVTTLWDLGRSRPLLVADLGASPMIGVNSEGTLIAKAGGGDTARLYRLEMSKVTWALPVRSSIQRDSVQSTATSVIDYSPDGRWLATAVWGAVQMRDASGAIVAVAPQGLSTNRCTVHFSRDGQSLLAASTDLGLVRIPVLVSGNGAPSLGESITIDPEPGFSIADVSHDGTLAVLTAVRKGLCKVVRLEGPPTGPRWSLPGAAGAAFVDDGRDVLANSVDDSKGALIELRDAASGQLRRTLDYPHGGHIHASADGVRVILGAGEDKSYLLRVADWSLGPALPKEVQGRGKQPAFSPDGRLLAIGVGDVVHLLRTADGAVLAHLQSPQGGTYLPGLAFSPDGARLALWWENGQLTVWDLNALHGALATRNLDW